MLLGKILANEVARAVQQPVQGPRISHETTTLLTGNGLSFRNVMPTINSLPSRRQLWPAIFSTRLAERCGVSASARLDHREPEDRQCQDGCDDQDRKRSESLFHG